MAENNPHHPAREIFKTRLKEIKKERLKLEIEESDIYRLYPDLRAEWDAGAEPKT